MARFDVSASYEEARVDELAVGDRTLVRYYSGGEYVEEEWIVEAVRTRTYGKGTRVFVTWQGEAREVSYRPEKIVGRATGPKLPPLSWPSNDVTP